jgi:hypothetical protein
VPARAPERRAEVKAVEVVVGIVDDGGVVSLVR